MANNIAADGAQCLAGVGVVPDQLPRPIAQPNQAAINLSVC